MTRASCFMALLALGAATPVRATPVTMDFSGTAPACALVLTCAFTGSVSWDSTETATLSGTGFSNFHLLGGTFALNGTDESADIDLAVSTLSVQQLATHDELDVFLLFTPSPNIDPLDLLTQFLGFVEMPTGTFPSTALPADLSFLADATLSGSGIQSGKNEFVGSFHAFAPTVPEPATLTLTALGLAGLVSRSRRRRAAR